MRDVATWGAAVVIVLHDPSLAVRCADSLAVMHEGRTVACGTPATVCSGTVLSEVFGVELAVTGSLTGGGFFVTLKAWLETSSEPKTAHSGAARGQVSSP
jgi:ABC-type hemin transport system ATPase subunit